MSCVEYTPRENRRLAIPAHGVNRPLWGPQALLVIVITSETAAVLNHDTRVNGLVLRIDPT
jgi:hypothetical protein